jgi:hypothetical protein
MMHLWATYVEGLTDPLTLAEKRPPLTVSESVLVDKGEKFTVANPIRDWLFDSEAWLTPLFLFLFFFLSHFHFHFHLLTQYANLGFSCFRYLEVWSINLADSDWLM